MAYKKKLLWLQAISCNGNSHSFFNYIDFFSIVSKFELIYHPLVETPYSLDEVLEGKLSCDILIVEGSLKEGLTKGGIDISKLIEGYADRAEWVVTVGSCATFGGVFKEYQPDSIEGFCFSGDERGGRYSRYSSKLISLSGCPINPKWLSFVLMMIVKGREVSVDEFHRPRELYGVTVHSGCVRNEYFEWKVDTKGWGLREGCLFYESGCQAPYTHGSCNRILWSDISSKTSVGTPCFGCTEPTFPKRGLFETKTNMGIPASMPLGVPRRAYLTVTGVAKSFKIKRLEEGN